ncbi:transposase [Algoriphagus sp. H41]|uniref:Transposase n=1 Tax=Algoriphagus oliviformis TaxID=2811231 RepID=A0ABS3C8G4_9BACT|nr:transposase [Algoriphagus oliviformis]MBN7812455.1 transposase [Algoriphagus oliviformis]
MEYAQSYHVYNHANGSENIFREEENYRFFLSQYAKYLGDVLDTYAYCLMPNHFHFLVGVKETDLSGFQNLTGLIGHPSRNPAIKGFSDLFNSYTKAFNKRFGRKGSLFQRAFSRKPILSQEQWQETFLYIHLNPVKHGFSDSIEHWKWSSWKAYNHLEQASLVDRSYYRNFFDGMSHVWDMISVKRELILSKEFE